MRRTAYKYCTRFLHFVTSHIKEMIISSIFTFIFVTIYYWFLQAPVNDAWGWLIAYGRILQDGFRSGFMHGTPFKSSQGAWAVDWRLGGQPFVHVVIFYFFVGISVFGSASCVVYLLSKYHSFRRLKGIWTYRGLPKSFWSYVSASIFVTLIIVSLVGITGTTINPNLIVPAQPSKDYLAFETQVTAEVFVTITRSVKVNVDPPVLEKDNMTGRLSCIIVTPEISCWNISAVNASTVVLNNTIKPCSIILCHDCNGARARKPYIRFTAK